MKQYLLYDGQMGRIKTRMAAPDNVAEHIGPHLELGNEITEQEWNLQPERWWKVDLETKSLIDLTDDELRLVQGIKANAPLPARPDMKARGR